MIDRFLDMRLSRPWLPVAALMMTPFAASIRDLGSPSILLTCSLLPGLGLAIASMSGRGGH